MPQDPAPAPQAVRSSALQPPQRPRDRAAALRNVRTSPATGPALLRTHARRRAAPSCAPPTPRLLRLAPAPPSSSTRPLPRPSSGCSIVGELGPCSRWLRLLFAREFHINDVLRLWDGIFADDPRLSVVDYMSVAMLLFIRDGRKSSCARQGGARHRADRPTSPTRHSGYCGAQCCNRTTRAAWAGS